jgi:hypothetical protein
MHDDFRSKNNVERSSVAHPRPFHAYTEQDTN